MDKWPGASFFGSLHSACAQNKTLISNTVCVCTVKDMKIMVHKG